jgi:hypothetical protein
MELLGDEAQVEARFGPFGDSANLDEVHGLCQTYHRLGNRFGRIRWNSEVTWAMWNFVSVYLEIVLVSVQDSWMVRAKRTIRSENRGLKIVLDAPDGTPGGRGSSGSTFKSVCR